MFKLKLFFVLNCIVLVVHAITPFPDPENGKCGFSSVKPSKHRIIGGSTAANAEFPWAVLIGYGDMRMNDFRCGGSIISQRHVLTAAHCISNDLSYVRVGEFDQTTQRDGQHKDIAVSHKAIHRGYEKNAVVHDIALLWLATLIQYNERIQPICLPSSDMSNSKFIHQSVTVAGWGRRVRGDPNIVNQVVHPTQRDSPVLKKVSFKVEDPNDCRRSYKINSDLQICVADKAYGQGGCQGDSGGPLMTKGRNQQYFQIGVVSYGPSTCDSTEKPNVYTSVLGYLSWIKGAVNQFSRFDP